MARFSIGSPNKGLGIHKRTSDGLNPLVSKKDPEVMNLIHQSSSGSTHKDISQYICTNDLQKNKTKKKSVIQLNGPLGHYLQVTKIENKILLLAARRFQLINYKKSIDEKKKPNRWYNFIKLNKT